jgi:hypothetical protein
MRVQVGVPVAFALELAATLACALFAGASLHITLVEHPAREEPLTVGADPEQLRPDPQPGRSSCRTVRRLWPPMHRLQLLREWALSKVSIAGANRDTLLAIRPGGQGDVSDSHLAWRAEIGLSEMASPLFYQGRLYFVRNGGIVTAYGPSGERLFRERLTPGGHYAASPVAASGRIYAASDEGTIVVFSAGEKPEVLARNELGERVTATPAIVGKHLLVRTGTHLWAFGPRME